MKVAQRQKEKGRRRECSSSPHTRHNLTIPTHAPSAAGQSAVHQRHARRLQQRRRARQPASPACLLACVPAWQASKAPRRVQRRRSHYISTHKARRAFDSLPARMRACRLATSASRAALALHDSLGTRRRRGARACVWLGGGESGDAMLAAVAGARLARATAGRAGAPRLLGTAAADVVRGGVCLRFRKARARQAHALPTGGLARECCDGWLTLAWRGRLRLPRVCLAL